MTLKQCCHFSLFQAKSSMFENEKAYSNYKQHIAYLKVHIAFLALNVFVTLSKYYIINICYAALKYRAGAFFFCTHQDTEEVR